MTPTPPETATAREIVAAAKEISEHPVPLWDCDEHDMQTLIAILSRHRSDQVERLTKALLHVRQRFADYWWNPDDGGGGDMRKVPEAVDEALASEGKTETDDPNLRRAWQPAMAVGDMRDDKPQPAAVLHTDNDCRLEAKSAEPVTAGETASSSPPPAESVANAIVDEITQEYGDEVWIGDGYAAGMELREKIAATICSLQSRLDAAVKVIEHLAKQKKSSEMDELYMAEVGYGDCAKPSDLPWQDACEMMIDEARDYLAKQERT